MSDVKASHGEGGQARATRRAASWPGSDSIRFFGRARLTVEEAERELKRPLTGDPSRGERGVLAALGDRQMEEARRLLRHDATLAADFMAFVEKRMAATRDRPWRAWRIQVPGDVWEEYARESRMRGIPVGECLSAAVERDYEQRQQSVRPTREIESAGVSAAQILGVLRTMASELREVMPRLERIEGTLTSAAPAAGKGRRS